jgi:hypothetical protein
MEIDQAMVGLPSVLGMWVFFVLMMGPVLLIIIGAKDILKKTQKNTAFLLIIGAVLLGISSFDFILNIVLLQFVDVKAYAQIAVYKGIAVMALRYIGYLLIGIGIYVHAKDLKPVS